MMADIEIMNKADKLIKEGNYVRIQKHENRTIKENINSIEDVVNFLEEGIELIWKDDSYNNTVNKIIIYLRRVIE
jgi:hypothetical protein